MTEELILLCVKVFCSRILDVTLGTIRTIEIVKGRRVVAACFGFCEVFLWYVVVRAALSSDLTSPLVALSYAGGFATGTLMGCVISERFISRKLCLQVITSSRNLEMIHTIRAAGFGVATMEVLGSEFSPERYMLYIEIDGRQLKKARELIKKLDPGAFITVQESKTVIGGYFAK